MTALAWIESPLVVALGWALLHFLWQGAAIGIVHAIARALIPKARCDLRYGAGLVALLALALCLPLTLCVLLSHVPSGASASVSVSAALTSVAAVAEGVRASADFGAWLAALVGLWLAGVVLVGARALAQWHELARIARDHRAPDGQLAALFARLVERFGTSRRVRLLVCARIDTPTLVGWIKPVILLPTAVALGFPREQIELILAHELGHLRRCDHLVNLLQVIVETILFYHPVVHWISAEVRNERELCCDALVLRRTEGRRAEYARTLAALEELRHAPAAQLVLAASGGVLLDRVRRIVGLPADPLALTNETQPAQRALIAAGAALAIALLLRIGPTFETLRPARMVVDWLPRSELTVAPMLAFTVPRLAARIEPLVPHVRSSPIRSQETSLVTHSAEPTAAPVARVIATMPTPSAPSHTANGDESPLRSPTAVAHSQIASEADAAIAAPVSASIDVRAAAIPTPQQPIASLTASAPDAAPLLPQAVRRVAPAFPSGVRSDVRTRVEASFEIDAHGNVRNIVIANNGTDRAFARSAEAALRQWRFPPNAERSARYLQTFVFAPAGSTADQRAVVEGECIPMTGSHICRRVDDAHAAGTH